MINQSNIKAAGGVHSESLKSEIEGFATVFECEYSAGGEGRLMVILSTSQFSVYPLPHGWYAKVAIEATSGLIFGSATADVMAMFLMTECSDGMKYKTEYKNKITTAISTQDKHKICVAMEAINKELNEDMEKNGAF